MINPIYTIKNHKLKTVYIEDENCSKVDGHIHSKYSDTLIDSPITRFIKCNESYSIPEEMYEVGKERGMTHFAIQDHDEVKGALELRHAHPENSFVNCEYTIKVHDRNDGAVIHAGVWGLDYAGSVTKPLEDKIVLELHEEILNAAGKNYLKFLDLCKHPSVNIFKRTPLNHPAFQLNTKRPFDGALLDELTSAFSGLEINGESPAIENFLIFQIAMDKNKKICSGSDAHTLGGITNQFNVSLYEVNTSYEYLQAFEKGDTGIGGRKEIPKTIIDPSLEDICRYKFNGTAANFRHAIQEGAKPFLRQPENKKWKSLFYGFYPITHLLIPAYIAGSEKENVKKRVRKLYKDYYTPPIEKEYEKERAKIIGIMAETDEAIKGYGIKTRKSSKNNHLHPIEKKYERRRAKIVKIIGKTDEAIKKSGERELRDIKTPYDWGDKFANFMARKLDWILEGLGLKKNIDSDSDWSNREWLTERKKEIGEK